MWHGLITDKYIPDKYVYPKILFDNLKHYFEKNQSPWRVTPWMNVWFNQYSGDEGLSRIKVFRWWVKRLHIIKKAQKLIIFLSLYIQSVQGGQSEHFGF